MSKISASRIFRMKSYPIKVLLLCSLFSKFSYMNGENPRPQTYVLSTFAGRPGTRGHIDGDRAIARFGFIAGITADAAGNVYVSEGTSIRKVTPDGTVRTTAGQWQRVGTNDGPADVATFG